MNLLKLKKNNRQLKIAFYDIYLTQNKREIPMSAPPPAQQRRHNIFNSLLVSLLWRDGRPRVLGTNFLWQVIIISKPLLPTAPVLFRTSPDQWMARRGPTPKFCLREKCGTNDSSARLVSWKSFLNC